MKIPDLDPKCISLWVKRMREDREICMKGLRGPSPWGWWWGATLEIHSAVSLISIVTSSLFFNLFIFFHVVLGANRDVRLLAETRGARHLHQSGAAVSPLRKVPTVVQPPGQASLNAWEAGHEVKPPSNGYAGREVIMTSYQELTAGGESSLLFTGCCRAKEVTDRDVDRRTRSELSDEREAACFKWDFAHIPTSSPPPTVWLRALLPRHHSGWVLVPCPLAAPGQSSPGRGRCA